MRIEDDCKLDFVDVLIRPKRSALTSRSEVDIRRTFRFVHTGRHWTGFPVIAANMDTTGTFAMAEALVSFDAMTALHKHHPVDTLVEFFGSNASANAFYTMGTSDADKAKLYKIQQRVKVDKICIDAANGYTNSFFDTVKRLRDDNPTAIILAGNVVTGEMTEALVHAGADVVKLGIGPGSVCTTRKLTGVGYPQLSSIIECADAAHGLKALVCADGGCTSPGDIAKAFGAGTDFVMLGGMLAGHDECQGEFLYREVDGQQVPVGMVFYGMSSATAMRKYYGGIAPYRASEGKTVIAAYRGPVAVTMKEIIGGVRSMMTYIGAAKLKEVSKRTTFIRVSRQSNLIYNYNEELNDGEVVKSEISRIKRGFDGTDRTVHLPNRSPVGSSESNELA